MHLCFKGPKMVLEGFIHANMASDINIDNLITTQNVLFDS